MLFNRCFCRFVASSILPKKKNFFHLDFFFVLLFAIVKLLFSRALLSLSINNCLNNNKLANSIYFMYTHTHLLFFSSHFYLLRTGVLVFGSHLKHFFRIKIFSIFFAAAAALLSHICDQFDRAYLQAQYLSFVCVCFFCIIHTPFNLTCLSFRRVLFSSCSFVFYLFSCS